MRKGECFQAGVGEGMSAKRPSRDYCGRLRTKAPRAGRRRELAAAAVIRGSNPLFVSQVRTLLSQSDDLIREVRQ